MRIKYVSHYSILIALSVVTGYLIHFPILPVAPYLLYDPGHIFILIAAFKFGPKDGIIMTFAYATLFVLLTGQGGPYGALMNFIATSGFVFVSSWIYFRKHDKNGALMGLFFGTLAMTVVMIPANLLITPLYLGVERSMVIQLLLPAIIPFNLLKGLISSVLTLLIYKRISSWMQK